MWHRKSQPGYELHGHAAGQRTPEYRIWRAARTRCNNPRIKGAENYTGRGIKMCKEWDSFSQFYKDMGQRPTAQHTLERKNNDGPYSKENCKWATRAEQVLNRRNTRWLTFNGETLSMRQWSVKLSIPYQAIAMRLWRKMPIERVLAQSNLQHPKIPLKYHVE